ncbi:MAG TPA: hypothetical protein VD905_10600 [Flavobacteriales bacterium]|nr:hypothetical protein [Flavobacteriales bacterium]
MIKLNLFIVFIVSVVEIFGQKNTTVTGHITYFYHADTVTFKPEIYSVETYDDKGERIYYHRPSLWERDRFQFERTVSTGHYQAGFGTKNDTSLYSYITDTLNKKRYIINNKDTQFVYVQVYENKKIVSEKCVKGGTYTDNYFYEPGKTIRETIWEDGNRSYGYELFDEKGRTTKWNMMMSTPGDTITGIKTVYDDAARTKTIIYGSAPRANGEIVVYTYNKKGIPTNMHYRHYDNQMLETEIKVAFRKIKKISPLP